MQKSNNRKKLLDLVCIMLYDKIVEICDFIRGLIFLSENIILKNEYITLKLSSTGASISEVTDFDGNTLLLGGDTLLFPVCGKVYSESITLGETSCKIPGFGFAKDTEFMLLESYEDYAEFILSSDDAIVENYPFSFNILVSYKLLGNAFEINVKVGNFSEYKMPYSLGINLNLPKGESKAEFISEEILEGYVLKGGLYRGEVTRLAPRNGKELELKNEFVMKDIISDSVSVLQNGKTGLNISKEGFSNFAYYDSDDCQVAGFWEGFASTFGKIDDFVNKNGIKLLDENSSDEYSLLISFNKY